MLKAAFDLESEVHTFMEGNRNPIAEFNHKKLTGEFSWVVDTK
jgi:hypothetical protein